MAKFLVQACVLLILLQHSQHHAVQGQRTLVSLSKKLKFLTSSDSTKKKTATTTAPLPFAEKDTTSTDSDVETDLHNAKVVLSFKGIHLEMKPKNKKQPPRLILDGSIRGVAKPGRLLAIMGPSGSGKSTLLDALAGKIKYSPKLSLHGRRYLNDELVSGDSQIPAAYIQQDTNFFPHMTVKETLDFRVELKVGSSLTKRERDKLVADLMDQLNLSISANTIVGNNKVRGLSGGERKRLSIACEMISSPSIIFLDEPTSGLDSYQAMQVVETLRKLADAGKTVIAVIHQPSQQAFAQFDDLLLLSEGKQMYFGPVSKVRSYMESLGYKASSETGTAEHILDCISKVNSPDKDAEQESLDRILHLASSAAGIGEHILELPKTDATKEKEKRFAAIGGTRPKANLLRQFKLLLGRSLSETFRGKGAIIIKVVQQVTLGVIYGGIYKLKNNQASIQDRIGLLSLIVIGANNMAMAGTIRAFPKEKTIITGEIGSKLYMTLPYFFAKAIAEIPLIASLSALFGGIVYSLTGLQRSRAKFQNFLGLVSLHTIASEAIGLMIGSISSSSDVALALFPPIVVLNIIFDGKNISEENIPKLLRWLPKIGLVRWGFEGLAINEFQGLKFDTGGPRRGPVTKTGEEALERFGLLGSSVGQVAKVQLMMIGTCWMMSYLGLSLTRQKYQYMANKPEE
ncbi:ABC-2 type transporter [Fragilaria crotonensis]|nr:ABC-2 type transporter [Fragilaria crotonensis]